MIWFNYCYLCDNNMLNRWVCGACVKRHGMDVGNPWERWSKEDLPFRTSKADAVPHWVKVQYWLIDPDLVVDVGL